MVGEIGGSDEEIAAKYIKEHIKKPVVAFIAGEAAPEGKVMGHAGAIISPGGAGSTKQKKEILRRNGVVVVEKLTEIPSAVKAVSLI